MEPGALLGAEPEPATVVARPPDSEPLGERHNPCAGLGAERGVIEAGLAVAAAGVGPRDRAVVAIPYRERPGIQTIEDPLRGPTLPALCVVVSAELGERRHRHGIEAPAVAGPPDSAGERREHLVLPAEVVLLRVAVADPEVCGVGTDPAHRAVTEAAAEDDLPLVVGQLVILDRHEDVASDREAAGPGRRAGRPAREQLVVRWRACGGAGAGAGSVTMTSAASGGTGVSVISSACSPVSGWEIRSSSMLMPSRWAYLGSSACSASMNAAMPPSRCASAMTCSASVVLPEDSGP